MAKQLTIPKPCQEKWSKMTDVGSECRHCATCNHNVLDFTMKTDAEVIEYFTRNSGKICGRFTASQLNRPLVTNRRSGRRRLSVAAASLATLLVAQQPFAQQPNHPVNVEQATSREYRLPTKVCVSDSIRTISGKIIDSNDGGRLHFCEVFIKGTEIGADCDKNGIFSIKIPQKNLSDLPLILVVKAFGYKKQQIKLPKRVRFEDIALLPIEYKPRRKKDEIFMGCPHF